MNKYAATAMLMTAAAGERIIVVERDHRAVRDAVQEFREPNEAYGFGAKIRVANGDESVRLPSGGRINFATPRSSRMRGLSADVVFIDNDAHRVFDSNDWSKVDRFRDDIAGVLTATGGKVVYS